MGTREAVSIAIKPPVNGRELTAEDVRYTFESILVDAVLDDLLVRQHRTADLTQRREVIHQIQRHLAQKQYYVHVPSGNYIAVWDPAVRGYGPNLGYDYGGRLVGAWLER